MRYLFFILSILPIKSFADCQSNIQSSSVTATKVITTDVPSHLKGATIIVRLADGRESKVPAELFKVVPRKRQEIVTEVTNNTNTVCSIDSPNKANRVSLLAGRGPKNDLNVSTSGSTSTISSINGLIGAVQYQRTITKAISIGGQIQTNNSVLGVVGLDF